MFTIQPSITHTIANIAPGFRALSIKVKGCDIQNETIASKMLEEACQSAINNDFPWAEAHLTAWSEAFKRFGAKPNRTPCSAAALRKRVFKDGGFGSINPIVDIYNAVSIKYAMPVGGENIDAYKGSPRLTISDGTELFDIMKNGELTNETPDAGEVIWRDDIGVTCRRWNWRQGVRTRIDSNTKNIWFILESLPEMPLESLYEAGQTMTDSLKLIMPEAVILQELISINN